MRYGCKNPWRSEVVSGDSESFGFTNKQPKKLEIDQGLCGRIGVDRQIDAVAKLRARAEGTANADSDVHAKIAFV